MWFSGLRVRLGLIRKYAPPFSNYVKVFSHPRSGTHLLEAFVAKNFYPNENLELGEFPYGHWKRRLINKKGYAYGKLFGSHLFPDTSVRKIDYPSIYIIRDGRAVMSSLYNTENFIYPDRSMISFSDFLRMKIDWIGSPGYKSKPKMTVAKHWSKHVDGWMETARKNKNIIIVRYEDLVNNPYEAYLSIYESYFKHLELKSKEAIEIIRSPVGLLPNQAKINSWSKNFSNDDEEFFYDQISTSSRKFLHNG